MKIAIIGTGNVGGALATQWAKAGHDILLGVRDTADFKGKELLENANTSVHSIAEAAQSAEVILVATPPQYAADLAATFGESQGKIIIDATNAIRTKPENYPTAYHAFAALTKADVVKCFNSTGFENMKNPNYGDVTLDMFIAGDSEQAKAVTKQLSKDAGFEDAGVWSTAVDHSTGSGKAQFEGATCSERSCDINASGFNKIKEILTMYSEKTQELKYAVTEGNPGFVVSAVNHWKVIKVGENQSRLEMTITMDLKKFMGTLMGGMLKKNINKLIPSIFDDLKIYAETGQISEQKKKRMAELAV